MIGDYKANQSTHMATSKNTFPKTNNNNNKKLISTEDSTLAMKFYPPPLLISRMNQRNAESMRNQQHWFSSSVFYILWFNLNITPLPLIHIEP